MMDSTDLWLVRHAQSVHHQTEQLQWDEVPLSEEGGRQVVRLAERFRSLPRVSALLSSPLLRAWDTATPIGADMGLAPVACPGLRELCFGEAGGLTIPQFQERWPDLYKQWQVHDDLDFRWPGGESRREFHERAVAAMGELVDAHRGERIVVVSHTGILGCYLAHLFLHDGSRWRDFVVRPASVTRVEVAPGGEARLLLRDDVSHLEAG
jgi:probable phosphoglycerate mutase